MYLDVFTHIKWGMLYVYVVIRADRCRRALRCLECDGEVSLMQVDVERPPALAIIVLLVIKLAAIGLRVIKTRTYYA